MTTIEHLRSLLAKATPRPWKWWTSNSFRRLSGADGRDGGVLCPVVQRSDGHPDIHGSEVDKELIAALVNAAPALLDVVEAAQRASIEMRDDGGTTWDETAAIDALHAAVDAMRAREKQCLSGCHSRSR